MITWSHRRALVPAAGVVFLLACENQARTPRRASEFHVPGPDSDAIQDRGEPPVTTDLYAVRVNKDGETLGPAVVQTGLNICRGTGGRCCSFPPWPGAASASSTSG